MAETFQSNTVLINLYWKRTCICRFLYKKRDISAQKRIRYSNVPLHPTKCLEISTSSVHIYFVNMIVLHVASYQDVQLTEYADTCRCCYQHPANGIRQQYSRPELWKAKISCDGLKTGVVQNRQYWKFCCCHWSLNSTRKNTKRSHLLKQQSQFTSY